MHTCLQGPLRVRGMFSDLLYQPWHCATVPLRQEWLSRESLPRRAGLSLQQFQTEYEAPNHPVVLTDGVRPPAGFARVERHTSTVLVLT